MPWRTWNLWTMIPDHLQTGFHLVKTCKQFISWTNNRAHETIVHLSIQSWIYDFERPSLPSHLDSELTKFRAPFEPPISLWQHLRLIRWSALRAAQRGGVLKSHMHLTQYVDQVCIICGSVKVTLCPPMSSVDGVCTCTTPSTHISVDLVIVL